MPDASLDVVNRFFTSLEKGDAAGVAACFAADSRVWTPGDHWFSGDHSPDEIQGLSATILALFPTGLRFQVSDITAQGERVAVEATSEGAHVNGRVYRNAYHMLFVIRDDQIVLLKEYMDTALAGDFLGHDAPPPS